MRRWKALRTRVGRAEEADKMRRCLPLISTFVLLPGVVSATECRFDYWQVIPANTPCAQFALPDFELRPAEHPPGVDETINRFCTPYVVTSSDGEQKVSYCYTGEGVRMGPTFTVREQKYVANFGFEGCRGASPVTGIVFHPAFGTPAANHAPLRPFTRENFKDPIRCR